MPKRMVIDLSHHNTVQDFGEVGAAGVIGIIHKATQGTGFVDDAYEERRAQAARYMLMWGAYHFGDASDPEAQVAHFLATVGDHKDMLYCLDWEPNGGNTMSRDQATIFLAELERLTRRKGVLYSGALAKEELGNEVDEFYGAHRLWLAQYGSTPVVQASWKSYWLWQYSDGANGPEPRNCPGVKSPCDTNSFDGTPAQLIAQWPGWPRDVPQPEPEPPPAPPEPVTISIKIAVPRGIPIEVFVDGNE